MDRSLNELLKWSIENSSSSQPAANGVTNGASSAPETAAAATGAAASSEPSRGLNPDILSALLGGPSDADLMKAAMAVITSEDPETTLDDKLTAFDNFEQLVESLDNANLMSNLALWTPLLGFLGNDDLHPDLRRMAAWCVGTAVQNNQPSQERLLAQNGIPTLVRLATRDSEQVPVRRKAVYALSSACRNYQPAMDVCVAALADAGRLADRAKKVDALNMDDVDEIMNILKADFLSAAAA